MVLRRLPSMSQEMAERYVNCTLPLAAKGKNVVRDLDPKIDLRNIRIRMKRKEVLLSVDNEFLIALVQHWTPSTAQYVSDRPTNN